MKVPKHLGLVVERLEALGVAVELVEVRKGEVGVVLPGGDLYRSDVRRFDEDEEEALDWATVVACVHREAEG